MPCKVNLLRASHNLSETFPPLNYETFLHGRTREGTAWGAPLCCIFYDGASVAKRPCVEFHYADGIAEVVRTPFIHIYIYICV